MSLKIYQNFVTDIESFDWEKHRAIVMYKEKRANGEFYFAIVTKYYGTPDDDDYDISKRFFDQTTIGRMEKFVGDRGFDGNGESDTFGQRVYNDAITETVIETDHRGKKVEREVLIKGRVIYKYNLPVNKENTEKLKKLEGPVDLDKNTKFIFISGSHKVLSVDSETFWKTSISDYLQNVRNDKNK